MTERVHTPSTCALCAWRTANRRWSKAILQLAERYPITMADIFDTGLSIQIRKQKHLRVRREEEQ